MFGPLSEARVTQIYGFAIDSTSGGEEPPLASAAAFGALPVPSQFLVQPTRSPTIVGVLSQNKAVRRISRLGLLCGQAFLAFGLFACSTLLRDSHSQRSAETAKGRRAQAPPVEEALAAQEPREANALAVAAQTELTVLTKTVTGELGG